MYSTVKCGFTSRTGRHSKSDMEVSERASLNWHDSELGRVEESVKAT